MAVTAVLGSLSSFSYSFAAADAVSVIAADAATTTVTTVADAAADTHLKMRKKAPKGVFFHSSFCKFSISLFVVSGVFLSGNTNPLLSYFETQSFLNGKSSISLTHL